MRVEARGKKLRQQARQNGEKKAVRCPDSRSPDGKKGQE